MFVFQPEEVPHESPKHLQRGQYRRHQVASDVTRFGQVKRQGPSKPQDEVFDDGEVVEELETEVSFEKVAKGRGTNRG